MTSITLAALKCLNKSPLKIGTHNGVFHCDELLGTYMLQLVLPDSVIVRSRDHSILQQCDIVIDVGNVYEPSKYLFDHHQKSFTESMSTILPGKPWTTKLSSAGLVYCHFGKEILKEVVGERSSEEIEAVFGHIYENFIQEIDAIDNGYPMFDGEPRYRITTNLSSRVNRLNKQWNTSNDSYNEEDAFSKAQLYVGNEFNETVKRATEIWWPARKIVSDSILNRFSIHESGLIMELDQFCPWKEHFFDLEKELDVDKPILYVIFSDSDGSWRVQAVSVNVGSYICRVFLPSKWQGLRDEELSTVAEINGCIFVHHTGFIGGNKTRDGALKMALTSIELSNIENSKYVFS